MAAERRSFYKRPLPHPATAFSSTEGRRIFREALLDGTMEGYFLLAEQFRTQDEPAFCGLSTLTMVLNALGVDPLRTWKGPWRWYHESMLDCCRPLEWVKKSGLLFAEFVCLSECHGLNVDAKHPEAAGGEPPEGSAGVDEGTATELLIQPCHTCEQKRVRLPEKHGLAEFRRDVEASCRAPHTPLVIVSYSRKQLHQTGDGHFSPVAGYHAGSDCVLILDTARFKYPPHWVPIEQLYRAMQPTDPASGTSRGWVVVNCVIPAAEQAVCGDGRNSSCSAAPAILPIQRAESESGSGQAEEARGAAELNASGDQQQSVAHMGGNLREGDMLVRFLSGGEGDPDHQGDEAASVARATSQAVSEAAAMQVARVVSGLH